MKVYTNLFFLASANGAQTILNIMYERKKKAPRFHFLLFLQQSKLNRKLVKNLRIFTLIFKRFHLFSPFVTEKDGKTCLNAEKMILTSKRCAKHPFTGQNTQQQSPILTLWSLMEPFKSCAE